MVKSYDGYTSYLLIVDAATQHIWVFLTVSKDPPLDIVCEFLHLHGHEEGGSIRTNQGGKLACLLDFQDLVLRTFHYTLEPTGADSPSQLRTVPLKITMTSLPCVHEHSSLDQVYQLITGSRRFYIQSISTIAWFTLRLGKLLSKGTMGSNRTLHSLNCLAPVYA